VSAQQLTEALLDCADELRLNVGEPGTEPVAISIESTYPRSKDGRRRSAGIGGLEPTGTGQSAMSLGKVNS
jgi:hypothetical protein